MNTARQKEIFLANMKPKFDANKVVFEAPLHSSMLSLAKAMNMRADMLKYHLGKARKLDLVKTIIAMNTGKYKWKHERESAFAMGSTFTTHGLRNLAEDPSGIV